MAFTVICLIIGFACFLGINVLPAKQAPYRAVCAYNGAKFTIGAKSTNTINVAVQLLDARAKAIAAVVHGSFYLSDNADGSTLTATATTSALAIGTNGVLQVISITGKAGTVTTDSSGRFDLNLIQTDTTKTYYLCVKLPDGSLAISSAISFA